MEPTTKLPADILKELDEIGARPHQWRSLINDTKKPGGSNDFTRALTTLVSLENAGMPVRDGKGNNIFHLLAMKNQGILSSVLHFQKTVTNGAVLLHKNWIDEKREDGMTPLVLLWFGARDLRDALRFKKGNAEIISCEHTWKATHLLIEGGAAIANTTPLGERVDDVIAEHLRLGLAPPDPVGSGAGVDELILAGCELRSLSGQTPEAKIKTRKPGRI